MDIIEQVKETERKAAEQKIAVKAEMTAIAADSEKEARRKAEDMLSTAKKQASETVAKAKAEAGAASEKAKAASDKAKQELARTVSANSEKAAKLLISYL